MVKGKTLGLIQAHARGWDGSLDHSLVEVGGRPAIQRTIERLLETSGIEASQSCIVVPDEGVNIGNNMIATARRPSGSARRASSRETGESKTPRHGVL